METPGDFEKEIRELARGLYRRAAEHKPSLFEPQDWVGRMIDWSLEDEALRAALFRFVDVLPSLDSAAEIGRHLRGTLRRLIMPSEVWSSSPRPCMREGWWRRWCATMWSG